jgi:hypothetical protein
LGGLTIYPADVLPFARSICRKKYFFNDSSGMPACPPKLTPMNDAEKVHAQKELTPRFGWLLAVCFAAVIFCGGLVWLMGEMYSDCCDLSWLSRFIH